MNDFIDFCQHRRSTRSFSSKHLDQEVIADIIIAASFAPSIGDLQPWEFVVVRDQEKISELSSLCPANEWVSQAPVVLAVIANTARVETYHGSEAVLFARDSCCAAIQNALLAAHQKGVGACWVSQFDSEDMRSALSAPSDREVVAIVALGYEDDSTRSKKDITPLSDFVFFDSHGNTAVDGAYRLKDYGLVARKKARKIQQSSDKSASDSVVEKFRKQLSDWIDRTKRK